ncbi:MAG TPA: hypothetical protein VGD64_14570 [Acidisarcina sp.]
MKFAQSIASRLALTSLCIAVLLAGCHKTADSPADFESAINDYYKAHPACLWSEPKKFPVQAATSDESKTEGYDALTDAGLLTRTTGEKRVMIIASKQVNNYDVSDKGRSTWTQNPTQPGYGNFCYSGREVTSIDSFATGASSDGAKTATVNYHYKVGSMAAWANSQEMQTAFPEIASAMSGQQVGHANLVMTGDHWQVTK